MSGSQSVPNIHGVHSVQRPSPAVRGASVLSNTVSPKRQLSLTTAVISTASQPWQSTTAVDPFTAAPQPHVGMYTYCIIRTFQVMNNWYSILLSSFYVQAERNYRDVLMHFFVCNNVRFIITDYTSAVITFNHLFLCANLHVLPSGQCSFHCLFCFFHPMLCHYIAWKYALLTVVMQPIQPSSCANIQVPDVLLTF